MNLPIIESILFGSLRPMIYITTEEINGNEHVEQLSLSELWKKFKASNIIPLGYSGIDENGSPMFTSLKSPEEGDDIDYLSLANMFSKPPQKLNELENLCIKGLSQFGTLVFDNKKPKKATKKAKLKYTPISEQYFPIDFQFNPDSLTSIPPFPIYKFYVNIIKAEMTRIKLALLDYSQKSQSDVSTKTEVLDTLKQLLCYAINAKESSPGVTIFPLNKLREADEIEDAKKQFKYSVFPILFQYLIKTYVELDLLFKPVLNCIVETDFEEVFYRCFNQYPPLNLQIELRATILINLAQQYIAINQLDALKFYYPDFVQLYSANPVNCTFPIVFKALENAIFLEQNNNIQQLVDDSYCTKTYIEKKKNVEQRINAMSNPREIYTYLEKAKDQLILFEDASIKLQSIPRRLYSWTIDQLETYKKHLNSSFNPIIKDIQTSPDKESSLPSPTEYAKNVLEEKYNRFVTEVERYQFENLEKVSCMNDGQKSRLINLIIENSAAYSVAMLDYIGYFNSLKKNYELNKTQMFKHVAKAIGSNERDVKGNFNVLDDSLGSGDERFKYTSYSFTETVKTDYDNIIRCK